MVINSHTPSPCGCSLYLQYHLRNRSLTWHVHHSKQLFHNQMSAQCFSNRNLSQIIACWTEQMQVLHLKDANLQRHSTQTKCTCFSLQLLYVIMLKQCKSPAFVIPYHTVPSNSDPSAEGWFKLYIFNLPKNLMMSKLDALHWKGLTSLLWIKFSDILCTAACLDKGVTPKVQSSDGVRGRIYICSKEMIP